MATIIELNELNKNFNKTIKDILINQELSNANDVESHALYKESQEKIEALTDNYNEAVGLLQKYLKRTTQALDETKVGEIKQRITTLRENFERNLEKIHCDQFDQFELALESLSAGSSAAKRNSALLQLEQAQRAHRAAIGDHMDKVQEHVNNLSNFEAKHHQRLSAAMLFRAERSEKNPGRKSKAIVRRYRPFGIGAKTGDPERDYIKKFSPDAIELNGTTWELKDKKKKAQEPTMAGATEVGVKKKKTLEEEWFFADTDYLKGRDQLVFDDLPAAGAFKPLTSAVKAHHALGLTRAAPFIINLNAMVKEDKKKGILAAEGAVTCELPINPSREEVETIMGMLAHTYIAKGWHLGEGVDLGVTPEQYRDEAYIACIRAGFRPDQLYVNGKRMSVSEKVRVEGDRERGKLEAAYQEKEQAEQEKAEKTDEGYIGIDEAVAQLARMVHCTDLNPATFFALPDDQQKTLFAQGSTRQRAEIMADCAFNDSPENIKNYMGIIRGPNPKLLTLQQADLLDYVAKFNLDRLGTIFNELLEAEKKDVFFNLIKNDIETAAKLLMQQKPEDAKALFAESLTQADKAEKDRKDDEAKNASKFDSFVQRFKKEGPPERFNLASRLLKQQHEHLSESMIYHLYSELKESERHEFVNQLAEKIDDATNRKILGIIVAQAFLDNKIGRVERILNRALKHAPSEEAKNQIMSAVYEALPSAARKEEVEEDEDQVGLQDMANVGAGNFYQELHAYETRQSRDDETQPNKTPLSERYRQVNGTETETEENRKVNERTIDANMRNLLKNRSETQRSSINYCYQQPSAVDIASALRRFFPAERRARQLEFLVVGAEKSEDKAKLAEIIKALGPFLAAKAVVGFRDGQNTQVVINIAKEIDHKFLAQVLSVCYSLGKPDLATECLQQLRRSQAQAFSQDDELNEGDKTHLLLQKEMLPHLNQPTLIQALIAGLPGKALAELINHFSNDKVQQAKIFNALNGDEKVALIKDPAPTVEQKARLFVSLDANKQQNCIETWLNDDNANAANQIIACWNLCQQSENSASLRTLQEELAANDNYKTVISNSTKTSEAFLLHYLSSVATNQQQQSVGERFQSIMDVQGRQFLNNNNQKTAYYMTVGQTLAKLENKDARESLFMKMGQNQPVPSRAVDDPATQVRASAIIHLVAQDKAPEARALAESLAPPASKDFVKKAVEKQAEELPQALKQKCHAAVGLPQQQQQQQPPQQQEHNTQDRRHNHT